MSDIALEWIKAAKDDLTAIDARYPGDLGLFPQGKPTNIEARCFAQFAKGIVKDIRELLV